MRFSIPDFDDLGRWWYVQTIGKQGLMKITCKSRTTQFTCNSRAKQLDSLHTASWSLAQVGGATIVWASVSLIEAERVSLPKPKASDSTLFSSFPVASI